MDINDNQQINTFLKGMNTDVSDALIDSSQYRYAENLRLVTNTDSNEGELRIVEGTGSAYDSLPGKILALTSIRDMLIAITKTSYTEYDEQHPGISIYTNRRKGAGQWFCVVDNIPYEEFVQDGETEPHFSLVTRWESDTNVKLYIAEGVKQIISLNVTKQYSHTGRNHNTIEDIAPYISYQLDAPDAVLSTGGSLKSAKVLYVYRYYNIGLPASQLSPLSIVVSLYDGYNKGYEAEKLSNRAVNVYISNPQNNPFSKIQIFRITYVLLGQDPTVNLIYDGDVIDQIKDTGQSVEEYGTSEFLGLMEAALIPKVIESKEDRLFAANVKYTKDNYDDELEGLDFRAYSSGDFENGWTDNYSSARDYNKLYIDSTSNYDFDNWKCPYGGTTFGGGVGPIVSWFYTTKLYYVDKDNTFYTTALKKTAAPVVSLRRGEVYRYGIIIYNSKGIKSSVNWIADIMIPDKPFNEYDGEFKGSYSYQGLAALPGYYGDPVNKWCVSIIGIEFEVNCTLIPDCAGFEIVRCKKTFDDSKIITQGILGITQNILKLTRWDDATPVYSDTSYIMPTGFITSLFLSDPNVSETLSPNRRYLLFASPEHTYQPDDIEDLINMYQTSSYLDTVQSYSMQTTIHAGTVLRKISSGVTAEYDNFVVFNNLLHQNIDNSHALCFQCRLDQTDTYRDIYHIGSILAGCSEPSDPLAKPLYIDTKQKGKCWETSVTNVAVTRKILSDHQKLNIRNVAYPNVPKPEDYVSTDKIFTFKDQITPINGVLYVEWMSCGLFSKQKPMVDSDVYDTYTSYESLNDLGESGGIIGGIGDAWNGGYLHPVGIPGRSVLFLTDSDYEDTIDNSVYAPVTVANLCKASTPYGGPLTYKSAKVDYMHQGQYFAVSNPTLVKAFVYDGDCYPGIFEYTSLHVYDNSIFNWANRAMINYYVPIEANMDLRATYGDLYSRLDNTKSYLIQPLAGGMDGFSLTMDEYLYNTAYHMMPELVPASQTIYEDIDTNNFDVRVCNSLAKTNNEHIDKWTEFKPTDFIDVDSRFGEITNMRLFKDKLLYWQADATGVLSVNERVLLNDTENHNIILGTGGVLLRFDYISTVYGMKKNQYEAEIQSNSNQYWWDEKRKEILLYTHGQQAVPLTKLKGVRNYINENTPNSHPALIYNNKYDEIICDVENEESIVYNERTQCFTSVYTMTPLYRAVVDGTTIITDDEDLYHMDVEDDDITLLGDDVYPMLLYVVNRQNVYVKVFDISTFGGRFYGGDSGINNLTFTFDTPLKQHSTGTGSNLITNREYDFRLDIPRNNNSSYGDRMRGKTMQCELKSSSNSGDFSLQYILTKYRMSWS